ncbi:MAG: rhomboid family intramembrane serine protease [Promethearchaeota archaeon]
MFIIDIESVKRAHVTLILIIINLFSFIILNMILGYEYLLFFTQINRNVIEKGELWRLFTPMFCHADIMHIFSNLAALLIFGTAVEEIYKSKIKYIIIYFVSGLIGNLFTLLIYPLDTISLGASGAIFGLIGAAFIVFIREEPTFLMLGLMYIGYFILSSFAPGINAIAHISGLIGGAGFGYLFSEKPSFDRY